MLALQTAINAGGLVSTSANIKNNLATQVRSPTQIQALPSPGEADFAHVQTIIY